MAEKQILTQTYFVRGQVPDNPTSHVRKINSCPGINIYAPSQTDLGNILHVEELLILTLWLVAMSHLWEEFGFCHTANSLIDHLSPQNDSFLSMCDINELILKSIKFFYV